MTGIYCLTAVLALVAPALLWRVWHLPAVRGDRPIFITRARAQEWREWRADDAPGYRER